MGFKTLQQRTPPPAAPGAPPQLRPIAHRPLWSLTEYICAAGPHDRPFEERHDRVSIALVTAGTFRYRTTTGEALLYPGAFLLGNAGTCYECGHEHSSGDRCLALHIDREWFAEIAAGSSASNRCEFRAAMLPASSRLATSALILQGASSQSLLAAEEAIVAVIESVVPVLATNHRPARRPKPAAARRMTAALNFIDEHFRGEICLDQLSAHVAMSKYHFLRTFRHVTGMTPHQYVLCRRLRAAAEALRTSSRPIACVALDQGFGDLSTFNQAFRRATGVTPTSYRAAAQLTSLR
jgi:AraC-like DNA-binding protein